MDTRIEKAGDKGIDQGIQSVFDREALIEIKKSGKGIPDRIMGTFRQPERLTWKKRAIDTHVGMMIAQVWDNENEPDKVLAIFLWWRSRLSDERYWEFLKLVWVAAGRKEYLASFAVLFQAQRPCRHFLMSLEEEEEFQALPDQFELYRVGDEMGLSWTLDHEYAERLAAEKGGKVISRWTFKREVVCLIHRTTGGLPLFMTEVIVIPEALRVDRKKVKARIGKVRTKLALVPKEEEVVGKFTPEVLGEREITEETVRMLEEKAL